MSTKRTKPYQDYVSAMMSIKTFKIPAITMPCRDRVAFTVIPNLV